MKLKRFSIGTLGLLAVSGLAWSCAGKSEDCNANLNCAPYGGEVGTSGASGASVNGGRGGSGGSSSGASGTSGTSGEGGNDVAAGSGGAPPTPCDGTLGPDLDACVISDEFGLFVAPSTNDDPLADGTQAHPYATVTQALAKIMKIKHVYVCAGEYQEPDTLVIPDRVSIFGKFTCDGGTWRYDSEVPAHLMPKNPIGATITGAKVGVRIQDVRIDADAVPVSAFGGSSFGLIVNASQGVVLSHSEIRAGKAAAGRDGAAGQPAADGLASTATQIGSDACVASSATSGSALIGGSCGSQGGDGAKGKAAGLSGESGTSGVPAMNLVAPAQPNGGAGASQDGVAGTNGNPGLGGKPGDNGAAAAAMGTFSADGYLVASGGDGTNGNPGQGGGGGGASKGKGSCVGASGGAGGMGGCGGNAGLAGTGGGASVALLSWNSNVTIDGSTLIGGPGGAGGNGGMGSAAGSGKGGGQGGEGNTTAGVASGGSGARGGDGGNGGSGAGGTGGPSIALVYDGTAPTRVGESTLSFAAAAAGGKGGTLGSVSAPDGLKGLAQDVYTKP